MMFAIPSWPLSVFTIQTLWYHILVQTINLLPPFSPFGALIFVRLRDVASSHKDVAIWGNIS